MCLLIFSSLQVFKTPDPLSLLLLFSHAFQFLVPNLCDDPSPDSSFPCPCSDVCVWGDSCYSFEYALSEHLHPFWGIPDHLCAEDDKYLFLTAEFLLECGTLVLLSYPTSLRGYPTGTSHPMARTELTWCTWCPPYACFSP